jgi:hypothetical protein
MVEAFQVMVMHLVVLASDGSIMEERLILKTKAVKKRRENACQIFGKL